MRANHFFHDYRITFLCAVMGGAYISSELDSLSSSRNFALVLWLAFLFPEEFCYGNRYAGRFGLYLIWCQGC